MLDLETQAEAAFLWDSRRNRIEQDARETRPNQTGYPGRGAQTSRCPGRSSFCGWYHARAARRSLPGVASRALVAAATPLLQQPKP